MQPSQSSVVQAALNHCLRDAKRPRIALPWEGLVPGFGCLPQPLQTMEPTCDLPPVGQSSSPEDIGTACALPAVALPRTFCIQPQAPGLPWPAIADAERQTALQRLRVLFSLFGTDCELGRLAVQLADENRLALT